MDKNWIYKERNKLNRNEIITYKPSIAITWAYIHMVISFYSEKCCSETHTHTHIYTHIHTHTHTHKHTRTNTYTQTHTQTHTHMPYSINWLMDI